jgi:peptide chain release factor 1
VTVAVLREPTAAEVRLNERDLEFKACRGSGAGGQHRNTTDSAVQLTHKPTGIQVRVESERSQHQNKETARAILRARLQEAEATHTKGKRDKKRRSQVGSGMRGDKVVTISIPRDSVVHHGTGKRTSYRRYRRGYLDDLE